MHCAICDREDDLISLDKRSGTFSDCTVCQAIIQECVDSYEPIPEVEVGDGGTEI